MMLDSWCDGVRWSVGWRHVFDRHSVVNEKTWVKWTLLVWVYSGYCVGMMWASIMHTFGWGRINWAKTCSPRSLPSSRIFRAFTSFLKISVANIQGSCHNFFFLLPDKLKKIAIPICIFIEYILSYFIIGDKEHPCLMKTIYRHKCLWIVVHMGEISQGVQNIKIMSYFCHFWLCTLAS